MREFLVLANESGRIVFAFDLTTFEISQIFERARPGVCTSPVSGRRASLVRSSETDAEIPSFPVASVVTSDAP
jgi:hypothetical protein